MHRPSSLTGPRSASSAMKRSGSCRISATPGMFILPFPMYTPLTDDRPESEDDLDNPIDQAGDVDELEFVGGRLVPARVRYRSSSKHKSKSNNHHLEVGLTMRSGAVYFDQHKAKRNER